jgi:ABC-type molybdate transport system substrate-binding protein
VVALLASPPVAVLRASAVPCGQQAEEATTTSHLRETSTIIIINTHTSYLQLLQLIITLAIDGSQE